jgi:hypothetical protein
VAAGGAVGEGTVGGERGAESAFGEPSDEGLVPESKKPSGNLHLTLRGWQEPPAEEHDLPSLSFQSSIVISSCGTALENMAGGKERRRDKHKAGEMGRRMLRNIEA